MALSDDPYRLRPPQFAFLAALLAASACSPDAAPSSKIKVPDVRARPAAPLASGSGESGAQVPGTSGRNQNDIAVAETARASTPAAASITARRCGWLSNPTPGNWWLFDGHGEWILATQGGEQAPGFDDMPDMSIAGWVETNGHYGYGCACMTISHDPATRRVIGIAGAKPKPLKQCRADRGLPRP
jgi:hypothetical protein